MIRVVAAPDVRYRFLNLVLAMLVVAVVVGGDPAVAQNQQRTFDYEVEVQAVDGTTTLMVNAEWSSPPPGVRGGGLLGVLVRRPVHRL